MHSPDRTYTLAELSAYAEANAFLTAEERQRLATYSRSKSANAIWATAIRYRPTRKDGRPQPR